MTTSRIAPEAFARIVRDGLPTGGVLVARARLLKEGKTLVVGEVGMSQAGEDDLVAHAVVTYSAPPGVRT